jgi:hypothetical protein
MTPGVRGVADLVSFLLDFVDSVRKRLANGFRVGVSTDAYKAESKGFDRNAENVTWSNHCNDSFA